MTAIDQLDHPATVYWHRELPPLDAEPIGVHTLEATSSRVSGTLGTVMTSGIAAITS